MNEAWKAVAGLAADAPAVRHVSFIHHHGRRGVKRMITGRGEIVRELCDTRLVRDGRPGIRGACRRISRVDPVLPVHLIELFGLGVVGLDLFVADGPGGRHAVVMAQLAEILFPEAIERGAEHLGGAADKIVDLGLERLPVRCQPGLGGHVAVDAEDLFDAPVPGFARQPVAALEDENLFTRGR